MTKSTNENFVTEERKCSTLPATNGIKNGKHAAANGEIKKVEKKNKSKKSQENTPNGTVVQEKKTVVKKGKTYCASCKKKCSGEVLRVQDKFFHTDCFKCKLCSCSLTQGGFFFQDDGYYCVNDYQKLFGVKCAACKEYVEGEVISVLGSTYHQKCLKCTRCRQIFPTGEKVICAGKEVYCCKCSKIPVHDDRSVSPSILNGIPSDCAGCNEDLREGQALIALDRQWHVGCFKCVSCGTILRGEYMGKDGVPYCEKDYHKLFGVKCAYCERYISGKVLQAGDNYHFHPTCARCTKCGDPFGDGEEMYLQGGAIWHPKCGPGPTQNGGLVNSVGPHGGINGHLPESDREFDGVSNSAASDMQYSLHSRTSSYNGSLNSVSSSFARKHFYQRPGSPGLILREYRMPPRYPEDISRVYTYSYLTEEPTLGYLRRPIEPYDKPPTSPHFHRPSSRPGTRSSSRSATLRSGAKPGMKVLVESIRSETPRPRSPHMNNEEPIEMAHYPAAKPPPPGEKPKIERDDFPAPPYPYSDPERRKRWSDTYRGVSVSEDEDEVDNVDVGSQEKLKKEEEELSKIASGIGKVFLQNVKEREKLQKWKLTHIDPRNASRCPSAAREPAYRLRYQSPVNASPSRNLDHPRPFDDDEQYDRSCSYRSSSMGRSTGAISSYNVPSSGEYPAAGHSSTALKSSTLPAYPSRLSPMGDYSLNGLGGKTQSTDFSSGKSDMSVGGSLSEVDRGGMNAGMGIQHPRPFYGGVSTLPYSSPHLRHSLPNMAATQSAQNLAEPLKVYPYHLLLITNYRLPPGVDRLNLERHLSDAEFETLFQCARSDFYRLPQWRRNELKRRARLF